MFVYLYIYFHYRFLWYYYFGICVILDRGQVSQIKSIDRCCQVDMHRTFCTFFAFHTIYFVYRPPVRVCNLTTQGQRWTKWILGQGHFHWIHNKSIKHLIPQRLLQSVFDTWLFPWLQTVNQRVVSLPVTPPPWQWCVVTLSEHIRCADLLREAGRRQIWRARWWGCRAWWCWWCRKEASSLWWDRRWCPRTGLPSRSSSRACDRWPIRRSLWGGDRGGGNKTPDISGSYATP